MNFIVFLLGTFLLYISSYANAHESTDNSRFAIVVSVFSVIGSLFGLFALYVRWPKCIHAHATWITVIALLSIITASACISAANVRTTEPECDGPECTVSGRLSTDRLLMLGAYAVTSSVVMIAEVAFVIRVLNNPVSKNTEQKSVEMMYSEFVEDVEKQKYSYKNEE